MTANQPRDRGRTPSRGFLDGPVVAALFRAARRAVSVPETPRPRFFVAAQNTGQATSVSMGGQSKCDQPRVEHRITGFFI
jgi:hypothetical protein